MRLQKLQGYKLPLTTDKQMLFACNFSVTFVTFETFLKFVTAKVTRNSLIISKCNFVIIVTVFFSQKSFSQSFFLEILTTFPILGREYDVPLAESRRK